MKTETADAWASPTDPVRYVNRRTGAVETERIYGEAGLRWCYGNPLGRLAVEALVKRAAFSRWYGRRMDRSSSREKIAPFLRDYGLDPSEFADPVDSYRTFNDFFYRKLKPSARPIALGADVLVFPADGRHLAFPNVEEAEGFFVKGQRFELDSFLSDVVLSQRFRGGSALFSRLCPVDYHRFHFPTDGTPEPARLVNGPLYSVNPLALRRNLSIFAENRRWLTDFATPRFGRVLLAEIGATNVGATVYTYAPSVPAAKGDEKGFFKFGGSYLITVFEPGRVRFDEDLVSNTSRGLETHARMGERCGLAAG